MLSWKICFVNFVDNFNLEYVLVRPEVDAALVLAAELVRGHEVGVDRLEHDLVPRGAVLGQVDAAVPALADQLHQVVLGVDVHLTQNICRYQKIYLRSPVSIFVIYTSTVQVDIYIYRALSRHGLYFVVIQYQSHRHHLFKT